MSVGGKMGTFIHYCKNCNAKLRVDESFLNSEIQCPACKNKIVLSNTDLPDATPANDDLPDAPDAPGFERKKAGNSTLASIHLNIADLNLPKREKALPEASEAQEKQEAEVAGEENNSADCLESSRKNSRNCNLDDPAEYSAYFWGRLGVKSVKFIAGLILLLGIFFTVWFIIEYSNNVRKIPELIKLEELNANFHKKEKKLNGEFSNAVTLLKGEGLINENGVLDGLVLPPEACVMPSPMPFTVMSRGDLRIALRILSQYQQRTLLVKQAFIDNFGKLLHFVSLPTASESTVIKDNHEIVISTGGSKSNFYLAEDPQRNRLTCFLKLISAIRSKSNAPERKGRVKAEDLRRSQAVADFISRRLFSQGSNTTIVRGSLDKSGKSGVDANTVQRDELAAEVFEINKIIKALSSEWQVDYELANMNILLNDIALCIKVFEIKRAQLRWMLCRQLVELYLAVLGSAFALLVLGDFLRGHFDMADIMRCKRDK